MKKKTLLGNLVRAAREELGLTQELLATLVSITPATVSRIENGGAVGQRTFENIVEQLTKRGLRLDQRIELWRAAGYYVNLTNPNLPNEAIATTIRLLGSLESADAEAASRHLYSRLEVELESIASRKLTATRRWEESLGHSQKAEALWNIHEQEFLLDLESGRGFSAFSKGSYRAALTHYRSALWNAQLLQGNLPDEARSYAIQEGNISLKLGSTYRRIGGQQYWKLAGDYYDGATKIFEKLSDDVQMAESWRKKGGTYLHQGLPLDAMDLFGRCMEVYKKHDDFRGIYKTLQHMGWAHLDYLGSLTDAVHSFEQALQIIKERKVEDDWEKLKAHSYLGNALLENDEIMRAADAFDEADKLLKGLEASGVDATITAYWVLLGRARTLAEIPGREGDAQNALRMTQENLQNLEGEHLRWAQLFNVRGSVLLKLGRLSDAERILKQASEDMLPLGNITYYIQTLANLAVLYFEKKANDELYETARRAIDVDNGFANQHLSRVLLFQGRARLNDAQYNKAFEDFNKALDKGLQFDSLIFARVKASIRQELSSLAHKGNQVLASRFVSASRQYWQSRRLDPIREKQIRNWLSEVESLVSGT
jgi:tetratricopeptide (TPR) repeat protein